MKYDGWCQKKAPLVFIMKKTRKIRINSGMSQEELAGKLNVSRQAVSKWETGTIPDVDNIIKISNYFDCSLDYLLNNEIVEKEVVQKETEAVEVLKSTGENKSKYGWKIIFSLMYVTAAVISLAIRFMAERTKVGVVIRESDTGRMLSGFQIYVDFYHLQAVICLCIVSFLPVKDNIMLQSSLYRRKATSCTCWSKTHN